MTVKKQKQTKSKKKFLLPLLLITLAASLFCLVRFSLADLNFSGFGWIGNNWINGTDTGEPAIGWLSFSSGQTNPSCAGAAYAVTLGGNQGDDTRPVNGYAWFGIGSAPDLYSATLSGLTCPLVRDDESLGWVDFQAGSPSSCVSLPGNTIDTNDCHSAQWHDVDSDPNNGFAGHIDGWARIISMSTMNSTSPPYLPFNPTDDGWIRLKGSTYSFKLDKDGVATSDSYGWNSGIYGIKVSDNSGLGWIGFAKAEICSIFFQPPKDQTISENTSELTLHRNRADASSPVPVNLKSYNEPRLIPNDSSFTFLPKKESQNFGITIAKIPEDSCKDIVDFEATSICGKSPVHLTILKSCSTKCSPKEVTIIPGDTATFTADVQGYSIPSVNWSVSGGDSDCVDPAETSCCATANPLCTTGASCTLKIYATNHCAKQSFQVTAASSCTSCGSDNCTLFVSQPGWIETAP